MRYKVWIQIEAQPMRGEPYNVEEEVDVAVTKTLSQARLILEEVVDLYTDPVTIATWRQRHIYPFGKPFPSVTGRKVKLPHI